MGKKSRRDGAGRVTGEATGLLPPPAPVETSKGKASPPTPEEAWKEELRDLVRDLLDGRSAEASRSWFSFLLGEDEEGGRRAYRILMGENVDPREDGERLLSLLPPEDAEMLRELREEWGLDLKPEDLALALRVGGARWVPRVPEHRLVLRPFRRRRIAETTVLSLMLQRLRLLMKVGEYYQSGEWEKVIKEKGENLLNNGEQELEKEIYKMSSFSIEDALKWGRVPMSIWSTAESKEEVYAKVALLEAAAFDVGTRLIKSFFGGWGEVDETERRRRALTFLSSIIGEADSFFLLNPLAVKPKNNDVEAWKKDAIDHIKSVFWCELFWMNKKEWASTPSTIYKEDYTKRKGELVEGVISWAENAGMDEKEEEKLLRVAFFLEGSLWARDLKPNKTLDKWAEDWEAGTGWPENRIPRRTMFHRQRKVSLVLHELLEAPEALEEITGLKGIGEAAREGRWGWGTRLAMEEEWPSSRFWFGRSVGDGQDLLMTLALTEGPKGRREARWAEANALLEHAFFHLSALDLQRWEVVAQRPWLSPQILASLGEGDVKRGVERMRYLWGKAKEEADREMLQGQRRGEGTEEDMWKDWKDKVGFSFASLSYRDLLWVAETGGELSRPENHGWEIFSPEEAGWWEKAVEGKDVPGPPIPRRRFGSGELASARCFGDALEAAFKRAKKEDPKTRFLLAWALASIPPSKGAERCIPRLFGEGEEEGWERMVDLALSVWGRKRGGEKATKEALRMAGRVGTLGSDLAKVVLLHSDVEGDASPHEGAKKRVKEGGRGVAETVASRLRAFGCLGPTVRKSYWERMEKALSSSPWERMVKRKPSLAHLALWCPDPLSLVEAAREVEDEDFFLVRGERGRGQPPELSSAVAYAFGTLTMRAERLSPKDKRALYSLLRRRAEGCLREEGGEESDKGRRRKVAEALVESARGWEANLELRDPRGAVTIGKKEAFQAAAAVGDVAAGAVMLVNPREGSASRSKTPLYLVGAVSSGFWDAIWDWRWKGSVPDDRFFRTLWGVGRTVFPPSQVHEVARKRPDKLAKVFRAWGESPLSSPTLERLKGLRS
ncbi:MAG: hypothetical protein QXH08_00305, partial [Candidatus Hadarchaeales archaeon]